MNTTNRGVQAVWRDDKAERMHELATSILGNGFWEIRADEVNLVETTEGKSAEIVAKMTEKNGDDVKTLIIKGSGVGLVDAFFNALMDVFSKSYHSLEGIEIVEFSISSFFEGSHGRRSDALAEARIDIKNSENHIFSLAHRTPSTSLSSINVVQDVINLFVNGERAYVKLFQAIEDAKARNRSDLAARYERQLGEIVQLTSYVKIVERMRENK